MEQTRIVVIEINELREAIRKVLREEELNKHTNPSPETKTEYKDTDRLSISQVAEYLGFKCTKTVTNLLKKHKIPKPEYNLSGKPRWTVAQLKEVLNVRKAKQKFPVS